MSPRRSSALVALSFLPPAVVSFAGCSGGAAGGGDPRAAGVVAARSALETVPLIITEVAQSAL